MAVQIPGKGVGPGEDISEPGTSMLHDLNLLPTDSDLEAAKGLGAAFTGPPQSVAVLEAGATALSKAWAGGLGAGVIALWALVRAFYVGQEPATQRVILIGAAAMTAVAVGGICFLVASDVRGRAAASVATINARVAVTRAMIEAAGAAAPHGGASASDDGTCASTVPLSPPCSVRKIDEASDAEEGWTAMAMTAAEPPRFLVVKGSSVQWVEAKLLRFGSVAR